VKAPPQAGFFIFVRAFLTVVELSPAASHGTLLPFMALFSGYSAVHGLALRARFARIRKTFVEKERERTRESSASTHFDMVATKAKGFCPKGERMDARLTKGLPLAKPAYSGRTPRS
jgi:hypothetical protein